jgi:hypothetical protein
MLGSNRRRPDWPYGRQAKCKIYVPFVDGLIDTFNTDKLKDWQR